jgi:hypothetical protein
VLQAWLPDPDNLTNEEPRLLRCGAAWV